MYLYFHGEREDRLYHLHRFWRCVHTLRFEAREDKDEIVVEIWKLVELLQFLSGSVKDSQLFTRTHSLLLFDIWKVYVYRNQSDADDNPAPNQNLTHFFFIFHLLLSQTHTHFRILLARLSVLPCLGTASPSGAEALAADSVHLAATPSYNTKHPGQNKPLVSYLRVRRATLTHM